MHVVSSLPSFFVTGVRSWALIPFSHGVLTATQLDRSWVCVCAQLCLTPCGPMDCSSPGSSVHEISQARTLEWVIISYSRGSS